MSGLTEIKLVKLNGAGWGVESEYDRELLPALRALPGAQWDPNLKVWRVSTHDRDLIDLIDQLNQIGCPIPSDLLNRAETLAKKVDGKAQDVAQKAGNAGLYPYQIEGVKWLTQRIEEGRNSLLADSMGLGKTVQSLMALPKRARVLVVCPACIKGTWAHETRKWRDDLSPVKLSGRGSFRWPEPGEVLIINYDILPEPGRLSDAPSGVFVVLDEVHMAKNRKAQRTKRSSAIVDAANAAGGRAVGLTGTPLLNAPPELFQVLDTLNLVEETFGTFKRFYRDFNAGQGRFGTEWGKPNESVPVKLSRAQLRREREDVLPDLPGKTYSEMVVNGIPESVRELADDAMDEWREYMEEAGSTGLPPFEMMSHIREVLAHFKAPFALDRVEHFEDAGEPVVVMSAHRSPVEQLAERDGWEAILGGTDSDKRQEIVDRFQAGELKGLACTIKAGGMGVTLTEAHHMIFVDLEWTPAMNSQAEDRICRIGQDTGCQYITLIADHELDARLTDLLLQKTELIDATIQPSKPVSDAMDIVKAATDAGEAAEAEEPEPMDTVECPDCGRDVRVFTASEKSKHPGWKWAKCDCGKYIWVESKGFSDEEKAELRHSLEVLLGVCDGAKQRDGTGFNRNDAYPARRMHNELQQGLETDWIKLKNMLKKYRKTQLEERDSDGDAD